VLRETLVRDKKKKKGKEKKEIPGKKKG